MSDTKTLIGQTMGEGAKVIEVELQDSGLVKDAEGKLYNVMQSGEHHFFTLVEEGIESASDWVEKELPSIAPEVEAEATKVEDAVEAIEAVVEEQTASLLGQTEGDMTDGGDSAAEGSSETEPTDETPEA